MTTATKGSPDKFFYSREEVVEYLLHNILGNDKKLVGTEWECFWVDYTGNPITRANGQKAFENLAREFSIQGYHIQYQFEKIRDGSQKIVGLDIPGLGSIQLEAGHQFEFASIPCQTASELHQKNKIAHEVIATAARQIRHQVVYTGHRQGYAAKTQGVFRSRGNQWDHYYDERFVGEEYKDALAAVKEGQNGLASVQVTVDAGGPNFHKFYKALLLIEPAMTLRYTNSPRPAILQKYGQVIPEQVLPIAEVWNAKDTREAVEIITDRFEALPVPFLPNASGDGTYIAEHLDFNGLPPTVGDLRKQGRLSELNLNGAASFFYTRPALRAVTTGLLEIRGIDSQSSPETIHTIVCQIIGLLYNEQALDKLLSDYSHLTVEDIRELHRASAVTPGQANTVNVAGTTMDKFKDDIINRLNKHMVAAANNELGQRAVKSAASARGTSTTPVSALAVASPA